MAEGDSTAAAAGGTTGATAQPAASFQAPAEWSESEHYKPFFKEDKSFDVEGLAKAYADTKAQIRQYRRKPMNIASSFQRTFPWTKLLSNLRRKPPKALG